MDTMLTYGASGECVSQLTSLARAAGLDVPQTDQLDVETLDRIVTGLGLGTQLEGIITTAEQPYKGRVITDTVWAELRARAAANTGLQAIVEVPAAGTEQAPPAALAGQSSLVAGTDASQAAPAGAAAPGTDTPSPQGTVA